MSAVTPRELELRKTSQNGGDSPEIRLGAHAIAVLAMAVVSGFVSFSEFLHGFLCWVEDTADDTEGSDSSKGVD